MPAFTANLVLVRHAWSCWEVDFFDSAGNVRYRVSQFGGVVLPCATKLAAAI